MTVTLSSPLGVEDIDVPTMGGTRTVVTSRVLSLLNNGAEYVDVSTVDVNNTVHTDRRVPDVISDNGSVWVSTVVESWTS